MGKGFNLLVKCRGLEKPKGSKTILDASRIIKNTLNLQFEPYVIENSQSKRIQKFSTEPTMPCNQYSAAWPFFCAISTGAILFSIVHGHN